MIECLICKRAMICNRNGNLECPNHCNLIYDLSKAWATGFNEYDLKSSLIANEK